MHGILDALRRAGWSVAGHCDETVRGRPSTCWKMRKGSKILVGEGETDAEALSSIRVRAGLDPDEPLSDAGPWAAGRCGPPRGEKGEDRVFLQSEDFTHDVRLYVDGNFATTEDKLEYARRLASVMNDALPERKVPDATGDPA